MNYYIWRNDAQAGPYTLAQLRSMWGSGSVTSETLYWIEGMTDWQPLHNILEKLEPPQTNPPALPAASPDSEPCPYCRQPKPKQATRCPHCGGNTPLCPRCKKHVAVNETNKFVGMARGGMQKVGHCRVCGTKLFGPDCFVATAVYGDPHHPDVVALRYYRDTHLTRSPFGRTAIRVYYIIGPHLAIPFKSYPVLVRWTRRLLEAFVDSRLS